MDFSFTVDIPQGHVLFCRKTIQQMFVDSALKSGCMFILYSTKTDPNANLETSSHIISETEYVTFTFRFLSSSSSVKTKPYAECNYVVPE